jgi:hypothetical protein
MIHKMYNIINIMVVVVGGYNINAAVVVVGGKQGLGPGGSAPWE